jgi:hypothetical protein
VTQIKYAIVLIAFWSGAAYAITPYQEGVRDYYNGLCYRARPYDEIDMPDKAAQWVKGFDAAKKKDRNHLDREHCTPSAAARGGTPPYRQ